MRLSALFSCLPLSLAAHLTISIPSSPPLLSNPSTLPPTTHATLLGPDGTIHSSRLTRQNTITFSSLASGSHLLSIFTRDYTFPQYRIDVTPLSQSTPSDPKEAIEIVQTFRGNEWGNKGQVYGSGNDTVTIALSPNAKKEFYAQRQGFSALSILKNPMILMALVSAGLVFGMPYLMDNSKSFSCACGVLMGRKRGRVLWLTLGQWMRRPRRSLRRRRRVIRLLGVMRRLLCRTLISRDGWPERPPGAKEARKRRREGRNRYGRVIGEKIYDREDNTSNGKCIALLLDMSFVSRGEQLPLAVYMLIPKLLVGVHDEKPGRLSGEPDNELKCPAFEIWPRSALTPQISQLSTSMLSPCGASPPSLFSNVVSNHSLIS